MRGAALAAVLLAASCAPAGIPALDEPAAHEDPVLDRYRCENFLDAGQPAAAAEAGARLSIVPAGDEPTGDGHLRLFGHAFDLCVRRRRRAAADWEAYHGSWTPSRRLHVLCGDFVPDAGIGLMSSARRFAGHFTPAWPLAGAGLRRWTGFYDGFIRGAGLAADAGPASLSLFAGAPGEHLSDGTKVGGRTIGGMRALFAREALAAGATVLIEDHSSGAILAGLDAAVSAGPATAVAEISLAGGKTGGAWGSSVRLGAVRAAALVFSAPSGSTGPLSYLPGATERRGASRSGAAAALRALLPRRCFLEGSAELREWRDGYRSGREIGARVSFEVRRRAGSLLLTLREESGTELLHFPVPPPPAGGTNRRLSVEIASTASLGRVTSLRGNFRLLSDGDSSGWLAAAGIRFISRHSGMRIDAGGTLFRSERGRVTFRFYEPAVPDSYPWRIVSGESVRCYTVFLVRLGGVSVAAGGSWTRGERGRGELCVLLKM